MLQIIAMITMLIDHIGLLLDYFPFRIIGRVALPIYAYFTVCAVFYSKDFKKYICSMVFLGMVSEIPYILIQKTLILNIVLYWAVAAYMMYFIVHRHKPITRYIFMILFTIFFYFSPFESACFAWCWCCIWYITIFARNMENTKDSWLILALSTFLCIMFGFCISVKMEWYILSILSIPFVFFYNQREDCRFNNKLFKKVYKCFYPAHLMILYLVGDYLGKM